ncbi:glycosyltransferase family 2 protein [Jatrophihabitans telluris]|uniref:Glycosyltransferase family 2 protein n=1 Tax=Jatrophihabitans telluris TaxID=2038343 RepID=A0ABY4QYL8_9ACTN|nr:glycosyltransferase family 2 protein [Jatrophihabitans telluris]UQX88684.1 glycosyltransferase family 2 protein [Jatrophihabitans telluris]
MPERGTDNLDVWVIVRCFNEASVVRGVIEELRGHFPNVIGVDDGSTDESAAEMLAAGAMVVRHPVNLGGGAALQTGLEFALLDHGAAYVVCFDGDGQHRAEDAAAMVDHIRSTEVDILIGSRFLGSAQDMPRSRGVLLRLGRAFERLSTGIKLTDAHNGLRVFSRRFAATVDLQMNDMAYASELLGIIKRSGLAFAEYPVTVRYTDYSRAKGQRSINSVNIATDVWLHQVLKGRRR